MIGISFPSQKKAIAFPVRDLEPGTTPAPRHQPACCLPACVRSRPLLFTSKPPMSLGVLLHHPHPVSLSLPVSLQSRSPYLIQRDQEGISVESHHSSAQNTSAPSHHSQNEPTFLTETYRTSLPPHPIPSPSGPCPLALGLFLKDLRHTPTPVFSSLFPV